MVTCALLIGIKTDRSLEVMLTEKISVFSSIPSWMMSIVMHLVRGEELV